MPPVLGPASPSSRRLWSWLEAMGSTCVPSHMTMKLASSPSRNSSITISSPASPKRPASMDSAAATASAAVCGDDHALAGGQAAGLHHDGHGLRGQPRGIEIRARELAVARGGNAMAHQEFLGEGLGAFQLRRGLCWAEAGQATRAETDRRCRPPAALPGPTMVSATLFGGREVGQLLAAAPPRWAHCAPWVRAPCRHCPGPRALR